MSKENLPKARKQILAKFKNKYKEYFVVCQYVPHKTILFGDFATDDWGLEPFYDEQNDEYYAPEGWFEYSYVSDVNWQIEDELITWCYISKIEEECLI